MQVLQSAVGNRQSRSSLGFEVQDEVNDADDRQNDFDSDIELADIGMSLLDLVGSFKFVVFFIFSHGKPPS